LVRGFGEELARRLLTHDILGAVGGFEEVGWVALAVAELRGPSISDELLPYLRWH